MALERVRLLESPTGTVYRVRLLAPSLERVRLLESPTGGERGVREDPAARETSLERVRLLESLL